MTIKQLLSGFILLLLIVGMSGIAHADGFDPAFNPVFPTDLADLLEVKQDNPFLPDIFPINPADPIVVNMDLTVDYEVVGEDDDNYPITINVKNQGKTTVVEDFQVRIWTFNQDGDQMISDVFVVDEDLAEDQEVVLEYNVPKFGFDEAVFFTITVDSENDIEETNENNNEVSGALNVPEEPQGEFSIGDVTVNGVSLSEDSVTMVTNENDALIVEFEILNGLNVDVSIVDYNIYLDGGELSLQVEIEDPDVEILSGESHTAQMMIPLSSDFQGEYELEIHVQSQDNQDNQFWTWSDHDIDTTPISDADNDGVADEEDNCPGIANADQADGNTDGIGDACTDAQDDSSDDSSNDGSSDSGSDDSSGDSNTTPVTEDQQKFNDFDDDYEDLKDDYDKYRDDYRDAVREADTSDIEKYKDKLEDKVDDKLADLDDDIEDFIKDLEDKNTQEADDLIEKSEDLQDDIDRLRENIDDLLGTKKKSTSSTIYNAPAPSFVPSQANLPAVNNGVQLETLDFIPQAQNKVVSSGSTWEDSRTVALAIAGIVILLAIVVFFVALLLR